MSDETPRTHPEWSLEPVTLVEDEGLWRGAFAAELERIRPALGPHALRIEHVGSTSIPGIVAKPIVDLAIEIDSLDSAPACIVALELLGYRYVPEFEEMLPDRRYLKLDRDDFAFHVHIYGHGHKEFEDLILFRDHLHENPDDARAYEDLKKDLASRLGRRDYTRAKAPFIQSIIERARRRRG